MLIALTMLAALSAALHIRAEYAGRRTHIYVFKPLTVLFIIALALRGEASLYKWLVVAGLLFSLAGDVFLMLPRDRFLEGLASFLVAHLCYIAAFTLDGARVHVVAGLALLVYGGLMLRLLLPFLGRLKAPVMLYMLVILLMVWQASNRFLERWTVAALLALVGAALFAASDSLLAWNRFRRAFHAAQFLILCSYFAAQWLLALSVALRPS